MPRSGLEHRLATRADICISCANGISHLDIAEAFSDGRPDRFQPKTMGLDTQLIDDGTYFVIEAAGEVAGSGGWSRRATLYGGDQSPGRNAALLNPATDPAACAPCTLTLRMSGGRRTPDPRVV